MIKVTVISGHPKNFPNVDEGELNICSTSDLLFEISPNAPSKRMALAAIAAKLMGYLVGYLTKSGVDMKDFESVHITERVEGNLRHFQLVNANIDIIETTIPAYDYSKATYRRTFVGNGYVFNTWLEVHNSSKVLSDKHENG